MFIDTELDKKDAEQKQVNVELHEFMWKWKENTRRDAERLSLG